MKKITTATISNRNPAADAEISAIWEGETGGTVEPEGGEEEPEEEAEVGREVEGGSGVGAAKEGQLLVWVRRK